MDHPTGIADIFQAISLFFHNVDIHEVIQRHRSWFYVITFVWVFLEGETFLIFAGAAAAEDVLDIRLLILVAWVGSVCGDQLYFLLGRRYGPRVLNHFPKTKQNAEKAFALIKKYDIAFMLTYRFLWGVRNVSSFAVGCSGVPWRKFVVWNLLAALIWAITFPMFGYLFGEVLDNVIGQIEGVMMSLAGAVVLFFLIKFGIKKWKEHRQKKTDKAE